MNMDINKTVNTYSEKVNDYLKNRLSKDGGMFSNLTEAMKYSLLAGGKRVRPVLTLEFCRLSGERFEKALPFAAAIEMIHTYSLIHDDLPCMDDDELRRGRPTCHIQYGEATALLAGDALLTDAFGVMAGAVAETGILPEHAAKAISVMSEKAGSFGMVGGQTLDLNFEKTSEVPEAAIMDMYKLKTSNLISAACMLGCLAAGRPELTECAEEYGYNLGLAFQIKDDILDLTGDAALMGKNTGSDTDKNTVLKMVGVVEAEEMVKKFTERALRALNDFGDTDFLRAYSEYLIYRKN